jgi:hypothetical protein
MSTPTQAIDNVHEAVHPLPCVLLRVPDESSDADLLMACIPHRKDRLPVERDARAGLRWRCADGRLEELAIGRDSPDWVAVWNEIEGQGLLVCEMPDGLNSRPAHLDPGPSVFQPVGHWVLNKGGSSGWLTD